MDLMIRGAKVIEGSGKPAYTTDVAVLSGRIAEIGPHLGSRASEELDAAGLCLAPGFIDPHTHSDLMLLARPAGESKIRQGVTTEVLGNCGFSAAPIGKDGSAEIPLHGKDVGVDIDWASMGGYLDRLRDSGSFVNIVPLVGHGALRRAVMGMEARAPTAEEQDKMERLLYACLREGARGLSTGLVYVPSVYATPEEITALARVVASEGGIYATHMRNESGGVIQAVREAMGVSRRSGVRLQISHLKIIGKRNWGCIEELLQTIDDGLHSGVDLACDQYPYSASSTRLSDVFPAWVREGGTTPMISRLKDGAFRRRMRQDWTERPEDWDSLGGVSGWEGVLITEAPKVDGVVGRTLADLAAGEEDAFNVACELVVRTQGQVGCVFFDQSPDIMRRIMRHPSVLVGSDGASFSPKGTLAGFKPHPRSYGTFPRVLGRFVREEQLLTIEEAVKKMTYDTARHFRLEGRGEIRVGAWADIVLFDPEAVNDRATYEDPHQFPTGIPYVFVNGKPVIRDGQYTGALPGSIL